MTIWHQRLIIFLVKVLAVIGVAVFLAWIIFYNYYVKNDFLIKYVPENAIIYSTLKISPELRNSEIYNKIIAQLHRESGLNFDRPGVFNGLVGNNLSLAIVPISVQQEIKLEYLLIFDLSADNGEIDSLIKDLNALKLHTQLLENKSSRKKVLLASSSADLLSESIAIASQQKNSLGKNIKVVFDLRLFTPDKFLGKIYLDLASIAKLADQSSDFNIKAIGALLKMKKIGSLNMGINFKGDQIIGQNSQAVVNLDDIEKTLANLPANIKLDIKLFKLSDGVQEFLSNLKNIDLVQAEQVTDNIKYLEGNYKFNLENEILPLFANNSEVIVMRDNSFFLNLALADQSGSFDGQSLDRIITTYLANKNPISSKKQMPDNTYITQVIRPIGDVRIIDEDFQGIKLKSFTYANDEFIYVIWGNKIILANSKQKLYEFISNKKLWESWKENGTVLNFLAKDRENIYMDTYYLFADQRFNQLVSKLVLSSDLSTNDFWLILK